MKKQIWKQGKQMLLTLVAMIGFIASFKAQTVVWTEGFEGLTTSCGSGSGATLISSTCIPTGWLTSKNYPWIATGSNQYQGSQAIRMTGGWTGWLISGGASLTAGITYKLKFWYKRSACGNPPCSSAYNVKVGVTQTQSTAPATTTTVVSSGTSSLTYTEYTYTYTPTTSGTYYFGLQMSSNVSTAYENGYIDQMSLSFDCVAPGTPTFSVGDLTACVGGTKTYTATATGTAPAITYSILSGGATIDANTGIVSNITGNYTVRTTATNACGTATADRTVAVNAAPAIPVITADGAVTFCQGNDVELTSSYPSGNLWSTSAVSNSVSVNSPGSYTVIYTDANGCSSTSLPTVVTVNPNPVAVIAANGPVSFCDGGSVTLSTASATGILWSTGETVNSIVVSETASVTVTLTDANGCAGTSSTTSVIENPNPAAPVITPSGAVEFCDGNEVSLQSSALTGNVWSTTETTDEIQTDISGSYTVHVVDGNGCISPVSNTIVVTVNDNPVSVITAVGSTTFCEGGEVTLSSSSATGNVWSTTATTNEITVDENESVTLTVTDANGCSGTSSPMVITVNPLPATPSITPSGALEFCDGNEVSLQSSALTGNVWSTTATTDEIQVDASGTFTVHVVDANGCTSAVSSAVVVTVNDNPVPVITADGPITFCDGADVILSSSSPTGNLWSTGASGNEIEVNAGQSVTVTVTDANGCSGTSAPVIITVNPTPAPPVISASGATTFCPGSSVTLTSSTTTGNVWSTTETTNSISVNSAGSYTVTHTDANGCTAVSSPKVVTLNAVPSAVATLSGNIVLTASPAGQTYQWINCAANQAVSGATAITFTAVANGQYAVIVTNNSGCKDTSSCIQVSKVGLSDLSENLNISIYPNPASEEITIELGENTLFDLVIYDASGKEVSNRKNQESGSKINLKNFQHGIYSFVIISGGSKSIQRIVVE